ncbi:MAG: enoyl-CoA hydratase-related protein [Pseudomonadota bacterium]
MRYHAITLDINDGIAVLTFNLPANRNSLTLELQAEFLDALTRLRQCEEAGALVVTGAGHSFCSGADLRELSAIKGHTLGELGASMMERLTNPMITGLQNLPIPVVAAVNGAAAGAGASIALAADIVVAGHSAYFVATFLPRLGIVPDLGASWFLPRNMGRARSLGMVLLGERLPAARAQLWGLIWDCVADECVLDEAIAIARRLAKAPAHAALEARRAFDAADRNSLAGQLDYEKERQRELLDRPTFKEGVAAFIAKREPLFSR